MLIVKASYAARLMCRTQVLYISHAHTIPTLKPTAKQHKSMFSYCQSERLIIFFFNCAGLFSLVREWPEREGLMPGIGDTARGICCLCHKRFGEPHLHKVRACLPMEVVQHLPSLSNPLALLVLALN